MLAGNIWWKSLCYRLWTGDQLASRLNLPVLTYETLYGLGPRYDHLDQPGSTQPIRSSREKLLLCPTFRRERELGQDFQLLSTSNWFYGTAARWRSGCPLPDCIEKDAEKRTVLESILSTLNHFSGIFGLFYYWAAILSLCSFHFMLILLLLWILSALFLYCVNP